MNVYVYNFYKEHIEFDLFTFIIKNIRIWLFVVNFILIFMKNVFEIRKKTNTINTHLYYMYNTNMYWEKNRWFCFCAFTLYKCQSKRFMTRKNHRLFDPLFRFHFDISNMFLLMVRRTKWNVDLAFLFRRSPSWSSNIRRLL